MAATEQDLTGNAVLGEGDLKDLCEALHSVRAKYYFLGLQISVESNEIDCIEKEQTGVKERLREVLRARLKKTESLSWAHIDRALRSQMVGEPRLADSIQERYGRQSQADPELNKNLSSSSESLDLECAMDLSECEMTNLRKVFKRLFGRLCYAIKNPVEIATFLQKEGVLSRTVMNELLISPESQQTKAITLVRALDKRIKSHPHMTFAIIKVFLHDEALEETGREMWIETGE